MSAWLASLEAVELRRRFDEDGDEFEDDGFSFEEEEEDEDFEEEDDFDLDEDLPDDGLGLDEEE